MGRKKLLSLSATGAISSLLAVGFGLDSGAVTLASIAVMTFIAYVHDHASVWTPHCAPRQRNETNASFRSFAIGIGPVPFVMIPEVSPHQAVSALSSIGLSLNCECPRLPNSPLYEHSLTSAHAQGLRTSSSGSFSSPCAICSRTGTRTRRAACSTCSLRSSHSSPSCSSRHTEGRPSYCYSILGPGSLVTSHRTHGLPVCSALLS